MTPDDFDQIVAYLDDMLDMDSDEHESEYRVDVILANGTFLPDVDMWRMARRGEVAGLTCVRFTSSEDECPVFVSIADIVSIKFRRFS